METGDGLDDPTARRAEAIAVAASQLTSVPDGLGLDKAAGLSIAYGTSLHALKQRGELKRGESLLVLGASGGVGLAAVEIGAIMGARVIAGASSEEKLAFVRSSARPRRSTPARTTCAPASRRSRPKGSTSSTTRLAARSTEPALRSLAWKGRFLVIGFASGEIPRPPLNIPLLKGCDIRGVYWGDFAAREPEAHRANMAELMDWAKSGTSMFISMRPIRSRITARRSRRSPSGRRSARRCSPSVSG